MALYPDRLVLPLERISYVTTHSLDKKELLQWVHISGRRDLTVVFEKESPTGSIGLFDQQTSFKINEGTKVVVSRVFLILCSIS